MTRLIDRLAPPADQGADADSGLAQVRRWLPLAIFMILIVWYAVFAVERYQHSHLYGDEPEYLFEGQSVWNDGDLDLGDEFRDPDLRAFPGPLTFKLDANGQAGPANFMPTNGVVFTQPAYAVFGLLGVYLLFAAMNIASLVFMFVAASRYVARIPAALAIGVVGLSVPLAWHAASIWTEIPALLGVSALLALWPKIGRCRGATIAAMLILAFLPWLHQKYIVLVAGLLLALAADRVRVRPLATIAAAASLSVVGTLVYSQAVNGRLNFTQAGTTADVSSAFDLSVQRFVTMPFAWFFDQTRGYLPLAPVWVISLVGFGFLLRFRRSRWALVTFVIAFTPYFVVYFLGPFLGGDAPPGRETLPALPLLALGLAAGFHAVRGPVARAITGVLAAASVYMGTVPVFAYGMDVFFNNVGQPKLLNTLSTDRIDLAGLWPRMTVDRNVWALGTFFIVALAAASLAAYLFVSSRASAARTRPWRLSEPSRAGAWSGQAATAGGDAAGVDKAVRE